MTETPQEQIERLTMQRNEAREIYIRSAQVWASITEDLMAKHAAEKERLRGALDLVTRHRYDCYAAKTALAAKP